ncbi:putative monooxygenase [Trichophaea hybrida]|nr:putative monooxygenase [Trichophaea hybrida]
MSHTTTGLRAKPVLIIGAGIAGLTLAQALKDRRIPFLIFERDTSANSRLQGWALTIHFSLPQLLSLLPAALTARIDSTQVNPTLAYDRSDSIFINLADCGVKWRLPPGSGTRKRVSRDRFRRLLLEGLAENILWGKHFVGFKAEEEEDGVRAVFSDGSSYEGLLLVGVDGAASKVRSLLYCPEIAPPTQIPISFLGTSLHVSEPQIRPLLDLDPVLFQGCHPKSATWMWFSVMDSPETNGTAALPPEQHIWKIQLCLSWPSSDDPTAEIPATDAERVKVMRQKSLDFEPRLKTVFHDALRDNHGPVLSIDLADWYLPTQMWAAELGGRVTLAGDAAHTMAMYRGEGFNHAIMDDYKLLEAVKTIYDPTLPEYEVSNVREQAIREYEMEVRARGTSAVLMCREACMEVHRWDKLDENSAVMRKRIL